MTIKSTRDVRERHIVCSALLTEVEQALDDWIVTYAAEWCDEAQVKAAWKRIMDNGGTLAYVTDLRERVHSSNELDDAE